jgi:lipid-binding SYLF domain-containing protein
MDDRMRSLLTAAKGVFIVPSYGRAAIGLGAEGGAGILLVKQGDSGWSQPVFYNTGGLSIGLQAGAQGGMLVFVLNNQKAVDAFFKKTSVSLNAKAGLTVLNWSKMTQGSLGTGDIVAWSDTKGLFGDVATVELNGIRYNQKLNDAYYHRTLSASDIIAGKTSNAQADLLVQALATSTER